MSHALIVMATEAADNADAAVRAFEDAERPGFDLSVTTLTGRVEAFEALDASLALEQMTEKYSDRLGVPKAQQNFWFPVAEGTEGSQPATAFGWWAQNVDRLDEALKTSMLAQPLKRRRR